MSNANPQKGISFSVLILAAVISCLLGIFFANHKMNKHELVPYQFVGTVLDHAREVQTFSFNSSLGGKFDNQSLKGQWTLVFFGFTHCPMMCPTTMAELGKVYKQLEKDKVKPLPQVVMVSIDPERDDISRMAKYVKSFDKHFIGAVGDKAKVKAITHEFGIAYEKVKSRDGKAGDYDMQHSGAVIVLNPQGKLQAFFNWPHHAKDMVADYERLVKIS